MNKQNLFYVLLKRKIFRLKYFAGIQQSLWNRNIIKQHLHWPIKSLLKVEGTKYTKLGTKQKYPGNWHFLKLFSNSELPKKKTNKI